MRLAAMTVVLLAAVPTWAAPPVTGPAAAAVELPVSAKATVVFQVNGWVKARSRLTALIEKALPDDAKQLKELIDQKLPTLFDGRDVKGVDPDARVFLAVNDLNGLGMDTFPADWVVPVKDAAAFRDGFFKEDERKDMIKKANGITAIAIDGSPFFFVEKTGLVVITASEDRANEYAGRYEMLNTKRMGADVAATFLNADLALFVDLEKVNDAFGDEIKQFRGLIDFAFQNAGGNIPGLDPSQLETVKEMMKSVFQVIEDSRALVVAVEFRPEGLGFRLQGRFEKDSKTGQVLANETPDAHADLGKLPAGLVEYHASRFGPTVSGTFQKLVREFAAGEDQEEAVKAVEKYDAAVQAAGPGASISGSRPPDTAVTLTRYKDPAAAVAAQIALLKVLNKGASHSGVVLKEKPAVKESAGTYNGTTFHQVSLALDFEETVKKIPEAAREATLAGMKKNGKENLSYWIGSGDSAVIKVTATDWAAAQKALESRAKGAKDDAAFAATRAQLPAEASLLVLQETGHVMNAIADQIGLVGESIPGLPFELPKFTKVTAAPAFIGLSVVLKPEIGQFDLFVPAAAVGIIRKATADGK